MKYQGVVLLSIREYLGCYDGVDAWQHLKYVVGIETNDKEKIIDYKTKEEYSYISRTEQGMLNVARESVVLGNIYAIESPCHFFKKNKKYSPRQIDALISGSSYFLSEYQNMTAKGVKKLFK